jgi:hypothetical protein
MIFTTIDKGIFGYNKTIDGAMKAAKTQDIKDYDYIVDLNENSCNLCAGFYYTKHCKHLDFFKSKVA